jgi:hypothetical protein
VEVIPVHLCHHSLLFFDIIQSSLIIFGDLAAKDLSFNQLYLQIF